MYKDFNLDFFIYHFRVGGKGKKKKIYNPFLRTTYWLEKLTLISQYEKSKIYLRISKEPTSLDPHTWKNLWFSCTLKHPKGKSLYTYKYFN